MPVNDKHLLLDMFDRAGLKFREDSDGDIELTIGDPSNLDDREIYFSFNDDYSLEEVF